MVTCRNVREHDGNFFKKKGRKGDFLSNLFSLSKKTAFLESNYKIRHPHLNLPRYYDAQVKKCFGGMTSREADTFSKHNFGNIGSLLKVEINRWLINELLARWHTVDQVFRFGTLDLCLTIKEYSRILGVHYDTDFIVMPPLNQGFKIRMSRDLGIKKEIIGPRIERNECPLDFFSNLVANPDTYREN